jgi:hypothetical protein
LVPSTSIASPTLPVPIATIAVGAHQGAEAVGVEHEGGKAGIGGHELRRPVLVVHARETEADRHRGQGRGADIRHRAGFADGGQDGDPGIVDAVGKAGRAGAGLRQFFAAGGGASQAHAGAGAAAIDADEVFDHGK